MLCYAYVYRLVDTLVDNAGPHALGSLYSLSRRELQTTDTDLEGQFSSGSFDDSMLTHDNAIANDAQTGANRTWPAG